MHPGSVSLRPSISEGGKRRTASMIPGDFSTLTFQDRGASPSSLYSMETVEAQSLGT